MCGVFVSVCGMFTNKLLLRTCSDILLFLPQLSALVDERERGCTKRGGGGGRLPW